MQQEDGLDKSARLIQLECVVQAVGRQHPHGVILGASWALRCCAHEWHVTRTPMPKDPHKPLAHVYTVGWKGLQAGGQH